MKIWQNNLDMYLSRLHQKTIGVLIQIIIKGTL
jgi:hypothetical protein